MTKTQANTVAAYLTLKKSEFIEGREYWSNKISDGTISLNESQYAEALRNYTHFNGVISELSSMIIDLEINPKYR